MKMKIIWTDDNGDGGDNSDDDDDGDVDDKCGTSRTHIIYSKN